MAYQPKSYRKFVATAATATLVATAVSPAAAAPTQAADFTDVSQRYAESVDYIVNKGYAIGITPTQFGTAQSIKRVDAAVMIARALEPALDVANAPDSGFTDVPNRAKKYVDALKDAGIINGKSATQFASEDPITRGEMALILSRAFDERGLDGEADHNFTDVSDRYDEAVQALVKHKITQGKTETSFGTQDPIKRGEFAIFLHRVDEKFGYEKVDPEPIPGISEVTALNENQITLTFEEPVDEEQIDFIEEAGNRIVVYSNSETAQTAGLVSRVVNFNDEGTEATAVLVDNPSVEGNVEGLVEGREYTVALVDRYGTDTRLAKVIEKSAPTVLLAGIEAPTVSIEGQDDDQLVFSFSEEVTDAATNPVNYTFYDENDEEVEGVITDRGEFTNRTANDEVEFDIAPGVLEAGESYRVVLNQNIVAKDGSTFADEARSVVFDAPSIEEAKPEAAVARVTGVDVENNGYITVTFDKPINLAAVNEDLFKVSQADGREFDVTNVALEEGSDRNVVLTVAPLDVDGEQVTLRDGRTYQVSMPQGFAENAIYNNAVNDAVSNLTVAAATNAEVTEFTAELVRQEGEKDVADLLIALDQPATVTAAANIRIRDLDNTYVLADDANIEVYEDDSTGKTFIVRDVADSFVNVNAELEDRSFIPEEDGTYEVTVFADSFNAITTSTDPDEIKSNDAMDAELQGIDISAPEVESITAVSTEEIQVEFDEDINISGLEETDVRVAGFLRSVTGQVSPLTQLTGANLIEVSADGNVLTITPAHEAVKFTTGNTTDEVDFGLVEIAADSFTDENEIENDAFNSATDLDEADFNDEAAPVILGTEITAADELELTYSEAVRFNGGEPAEAGAQFTVTGALRNGTATTATNEDEDNTIELGFDRAIFEAGKVYPNAQLRYIANTVSAVEDVEDNRQPSQTVNGLVNANPKFAAQQPPTEQEVSEEIQRELQEAVETAVEEFGVPVAVDGTDITVEVTPETVANLNGTGFFEELVENGVNAVVINDQRYNLLEQAPAARSAIIADLLADDTATIGLVYSYGTGNEAVVDYTVTLGDVQ